MKLIDREPTQEMRISGQECLPENIPGRSAVATEVFLAMYDAAQEVKQEPVGEMTGHHPVGAGEMPTILWRDGYWPVIGTKLYTFPPDAQAEIAKRDASIEEYKQDLQLRDGHIEEQAAENERLKALIVKCEEVIERYTTREQDTMNGSFRVCCSTRPNESHSNCDAQEALAAIKEEGL